VQGNSISSLKMCPSHISRSERHDLSTPWLNHLLITLRSGIYASRRGEANCAARCVPSCLFSNDNTKIQLLDAERAKFIVEKVSWQDKLIPTELTFVCKQAEQERQAAVIRAEGEAEAASTISRALDKAGEAFVALRKIEAAKAIVQSLSANRNVTYVPSSGGNVLLNLPVDK